MTTRRSFVTLAQATGWLVLLTTLAPHAVHAAPDPGLTRAAVAASSVPFIENQGQADPRVAYYAPTFAGTVFVTRKGELVYSLPSARAARDPDGKARRSTGPGWSLTETFAGGAARPAGQDRSGTGISAFIGHDGARWRPSVSTYERLDLGRVWPGVSVALRAHGLNVEKLFTVEPGGTVDRIRVRVAGASGLALDPSGALVASTGPGNVTFTKPVAYQERDGVRREVAVAYRVTGREYGFRIGSYDRTRPIVIDPILQSTYLGGSAVDGVSAMALHPLNGDVYVAGFTASTDFPGTAGGPQAASAGANEAFVARLNPTLTTLVQATYLGGAGYDSAAALAIHPETGDVYVAGTASTNFPGTAGGAQPVFGGPAGDGAGFVARLNSALTDLVQSTYFGGTAIAAINALAVHSATGDVYVAGWRIQVSVPVTAFRREVFVARLNGALSALVNTTFFAAEKTDVDESFASAIAIHPATGEIYVAGLTSVTDLPSRAGGAQAAFGGGHGDGFVARFSPALGPPIQATYVGGSGFDGARSLVIDPITGDVYVAGDTISTDFPATQGGAQPAKVSQLEFDAFVARMNRELTAFRQATYLGGSGSDDAASALAILPATGDVYVAGWTGSSDFPGTTGGAQPTKTVNAPSFQVFVARLRRDLTALIQATYLGGSVSDSSRFAGEAASALAVHPTTADVYVAGSTLSTDFPPTAGGAQAAASGSTEAFVSRLTFGLAATDPLFTDVPPSHPFFAWIEALGRAAITGGCSAAPPQYCPDGGVTRSQMAVFLVRGIHGATFDPPAATGTRFADVPASHPFAKWIEQLARDGITSGCSASPPLYCPDAVVTRAEMAVFLVRARHGAGFEPPSPTGAVFVDVPPFHPFAEWIEQLAADGVTGGCAPKRYCPDELVTRGQMAVFLVRTFNLPM